MNEGSEGMGCDVMGKDEKGGKGRKKDMRTELKGV